MSEPQRPPDHPAVPRPRGHPFAMVMIVYSAIVLAGYGAFAYSQRELGDPEREEIPASVRSSPGGYRSYHFWHTGYHGGK